jgi:hypothetical protein
MTPTYPKRPAFFALKAIRAAVKTCVANEHGQDVFCLLCVIASTEDASHYRRPVTYYSGQLMPLIGTLSDSTFKRVRQRAVDSGWLVYIPGAKRKPASYFVTIPPQAQGLDDLPTDEGDEWSGEDDCDSGSDSGSPVTHNPAGMRTESDVEQDSRSQVNQHPSNIAPTSVQHPSGMWTTIIPIPNPNPLPVPETADAVSPAGAGKVLFPDLEGFTSEEKRETPLARNTPDVQAVFDAYRKHHPRAFAKPVPASKEWRAIAARLREGFSVADLIEAIEGCHVSPFHCGENDRQTKYQSLGLIVRDGSQVSKFIELARDGPAPVLSEKTQRGQRAVQSYIDRRYGAERRKDDPMVGQ